MVKDIYLKQIRSVILSRLKDYRFQLFFFGSQATRRSGRASDIDIAILPITPLPRGLLSEIREELEESYIPYSDPYGFSGGPDMPKIKKLAQGAENIQMLGWVDEKMLVELVGRCVATIYIPRDEDFGMAPIESMAAGKSVIGVAEGGLLETVVDWETGILIKADPSPEDAIKAVQEITAKRAKEMRRACEQRATQFDKQIFVEKMREVLEVRRRQIYACASHRQVLSALCWWHGEFLRRFAPFLKALRG